jgi:hypothetical protein
MAHYAKVVEGVVTQVIVAEAEFFDTFVDSSPGEWIQTSYNTHGGIHYNSETFEPSADQSKALRKNFACIGYTYNTELDAFISPKPNEDCVLNEETCRWESTIPCSTDGLSQWNEETLSWIEIESD